MRIVALAPGHRLQFEAAQDGFVLLYPEGMVELSATAADVLGRCREPVALDALISSICADYDDAAAPAIDADVRELVEDARGRGWLTVR